MKIETLAPAGSRDALERAVAAGADAVYLGCTAFSARAGAGNFAPDELRDAVRLCHLHGMRVHVTVNTLVKDGELDAVTDLLRMLCDARADAVLVQDLGILRIIRKQFPGLTVHASTQMALHNLTGVKWAASQGIRRVVLARECSLEEIRKAASAGTEVEVFGHGAQCVSVSGQCLFSSMAGGRSGNRGRCAQPCRMQYLYRGREGAWLSPRDVCMRDDLPALAEAGACSVKLEGRLKRPEYVATVTRSYRAALDGVADGTFRKADAGEKRELLQIFQRGGFMRGRAMGVNDAGFIDPARVNHGGVPVGRVEQADRRFAKIRTDLPLHDGDQLRIGTAQGDYETIYAGSETPAGGIANLRLREDARLRGGEPVVRLTDSEQLRRAMALPPPEISVSLSLRAVPGEPLSLTARSGICAVTAAGETVQAAQKAALTAERAEQQLRKTGGTAFSVTRCEIQTENAFVSASALNSLRRAALEMLTDAICGANAPDAVREMPPDACALPSGAHPGLCVVYRADRIPKEAAGMVTAWQPEDWRPDALDSGIASFPDGVWLQLPTDCEEGTLQAISAWVGAHREKLGGVVLGSVGQLGIDWTLPMGAGIGVPVMNRRAAQLLFEAGCVFVTASPELNRRELQILTEGRPPILIPSWGREQLMLLHHCPARTFLGLRSGHAACVMCDTHADDCLEGQDLTDRRGMRFPLKRVRLPEGCVVRLLNSAVTDIRREVSREGWPQLWRVEDETAGAAVTAGHWNRGVE